MPRCYTHGTTLPIAAVHQNRSALRHVAVVARAGPSIRLDPKDGKVFFVTIDNPNNPARPRCGNADRPKWRQRRSVVSQVSGHGYPLSYL